MPDNLFADIAAPAGTGSDSNIFGDIPLPQRRDLSQLGADIGAAHGLATVGPAATPPEPPPGAVDQILDLAKTAWQSGVAGVAPLFQLAQMLRTGKLPNPQIDPTAALAAQNLQQSAESSRFTAADPTSLWRGVLGGAAYVGPQVAAPSLLGLGAGEVAGALAAPAAERLAPVASRVATAAMAPATGVAADAEALSPVMARLISAGARAAGAATEGTGYGIGSLDPNRPLSEQWGDVAKQAGIAGGLAAGSAVAPWLAAGLRGRPGLDWLGRERGVAPPSVPAGAPTAQPDLQVPAEALAGAGPQPAPPSPPAAPTPLPAQGAFKATVATDPETGRSTVSVVDATGKSADLDFHDAAGGGFHPTALRSDDPVATQAAYRAARDLAGDQRSDLAAAPVTPPEGKPELAVDPDALYDFYSAGGKFKPTRGAPPLANQTEQMVEAARNYGFLKGPDDVAYLYDQLRQGRSEQDAMAGLVDRQKVPRQPPPITSEELAAITPGTTDAVDSPTNQDLVGLLAQRSGGALWTPETPAGDRPPWAPATGGKDWLTAEMLRRVEKAGYGTGDLPAAAPAPAGPPPTVNGDMAAILGSTGEGVTQAGTRVPFRWAATPSAELTASHELRGTELVPNPDFPDQLQPRDRSRVASLMQVQDIASKLDPEQLAESRVVSTGAPLVDQDGNVLSGNGRVAALRLAYQGDQGPGYQRWLVDNAQRFGLDPDNIGKMDSPVLVRVPTGDYDPVQLVHEANASGVAGMSATEQAAADARHLTPEVLAEYQPNLDGRIDNPENRDFLRAAIGRMASTPADYGRMFDSSGQVSQDGLRRVQAAMLHGAYGDPGLLERMLESHDDNTRGTAKALVSQAPGFLALDRAEQAGSVHPGLNVNRDLATAVDKLSELRSKGQKVPDYLAQRFIGQDELTPRQQAILGTLDNLKRSPRALAETLHRYNELVREAGDPRQGGLFGPSAPPDPVELWHRAVAEREQAGKSMPLFREEPEAPAPAPAPVRRAAGPSEKDRVRGAMLGGAIGDPDLAMRAVTHEDPRVRGLADAIGSVAPSLEISRRGAASGDLAPIDLRGPVHDAIRAFVDGRVKPGDDAASIARAVGSPEGARIATLMADSASHPGEVAKGLHRYVELHTLQAPDGGIPRDSLLAAALNAGEREHAGELLPLEETTPVHLGDGCPP